MKISEQIKAAQDRLVAIRTRQTEIKSLVETDEYELSDDENTELNALREEYETVGKKLKVMESLEKDFAERTPASRNGGAGDGAPAYVPQRKETHEPGDLIIQLGLVKAIAHLTKRNEKQVLEEKYKNNQALRAAFDYVKRTAVAPADTTTATWAAELVQSDIRGFLGTLEPNSVAAAMANRSLMLNFDGYQSITVPRMNPLGATPTEPAWVGEGGVIPLTQFSFGSAIINRYKLAAITTLTMELVERSTPQAESVLRDGMQKAYAKVLDQAFLSALAAVPGVRPAGIMNSVTAGTGVAGGGQNAVIGDIKALVGALIAQDMNMRPVLLMNSVDRLGLGMLTSPLGEMTFRDELDAGRLMGVEVVSSNNVPAKTVILIDAGALATAFDTPMFDISQIATVTEANADGTPPTQAGTAGAAPGATGTAGQVPVDGGQPVIGDGGGAGAGYTARSLWQTLSLRIASSCGNAVAKIRELLETPTWTISSQAI